MQSDARAGLSTGRRRGLRADLSFRELPDVCKDTSQVMELKWESNALKYQYKFFKTCAEIQKFQQCVRNNQVCRNDYEMSLVMPDQNTFCDNLKTILPVYTCGNAWDSSVSWDKLVYTDWRIVQACPARHYRQLSLSSHTLQTTQSEYIETISIYLHHLPVLTDRWCCSVTECRSYRTLHLSVHAEGLVFVQERRCSVLWISAHACNSKL